CASVSGFAGYRHVLVALSQRQPGIRLATCLSSYEHCRAISPLDARLNFGLQTVATATSVASSPQPAPPASSAVRPGVSAPTRPPASPASARRPAGWRRASGGRPRRGRPGKGRVREPRWRAGRRSGGRSLGRTPCRLVLHRRPAIRANGIVKVVVHLAASPGHLKPLVANPAGVDREFGVADVVELDAVFESLSDIQDDLLAVLLVVAGAQHHRRNV